MRRSPSRFQTALVLLAWLAQLWAPVVHGMAMAPAPGPGFCGTPSPTLAAKLHAYPQEIRSLLAASAGTGVAHQACLSACGTGTGGALPSTPRFLAPFAATHDLQATRDPVRDRHATVSTPPVRGPPA